jgi:hydrogenase maturation protease
MWWTLTGTKWSQLRFCNADISLGVGNILLTDEAIGVRIVEALEQRYILPDFVDVLDGGTAGMELLGDMANRDHLIIADAIVSKKNTPGTMMVLRDEEIPALFTNKISPHQLGLADVLSALRFTGEFPKKLTLVGIIPESLEPHIGLTPTVEAMIEPALEQVLAALRESGVEAILGSGSCLRSLSVFRRPRRCRFRQRLKRLPGVRCTISLFIRICRYMSLILRCLKGSGRGALSHPGCSAH